MDPYLRFIPAHAGNSDYRGKIQIREYGSSPRMRGTHKRAGRYRDT